MLRKLGLMLITCFVLLSITACSKKEEAKVSEDKVPETKTNKPKKLTELSDPIQLPELKKTEDDNRLEAIKKHIDRIQKEQLKNIITDLRKKNIGPIRAQNCFRQKSEEKFESSQRSQFFDKTALNTGCIL